MTTKEAIRHALGLAEDALLPAIDAMADAPLTYPTGNGGCHPLWVMGHLAVVEGMVTAMLTHGSNPASHWEPRFAQDSVAVSDASRYPTFHEVRATFLDLRRDNLKRLDAMTERDLDRATPWQPQGARGALRHGRQGPAHGGAPPDDAPRPGDRRTPRGRAAGTAGDHHAVPAGGQRVMEGNGDAGQPPTVDGRWMTRASARHSNSASATETVTAVREADGTRRIADDFVQ